MKQTKLIAIAVLAAACGKGASGNGSASGAGPASGSGVASGSGAASGSSAGSGAASGSSNGSGAASGAGAASGSSAGSDAAGGSRAGSDATDAGPPASDAAPHAAVDLPPARPCRIIVGGAKSDSRDCVELRHVMPAGEAFSLCTESLGTFDFAYDAQGRVVSAPGVTFSYAKPTGGAATRVTADGKAAVEFDAAGHLIRDGKNKYTYDASGRLVREAGGGRFETYTYKPDGTYSYANNYDDADEYCKAELVEVTRDDQGRIAREKFEGCAIADAQRTVAYRYDSPDRLSGVTVDLESDGTIELTAELRYDCAAGQ